MAASTTLDRALLAQLLGKQHDVIARRQAVSCGMSMQALRHRLRPEGPWLRLLPGVYLARTGSPSADQRDIAALLYAGPSSVITACAALRRLGMTAGLPMPMFNARLYCGNALIAVADAWWPEAGVVAEVDSREWHLSPEDWERTLRRHARLTAEGILVLHFTPKQIRTEPAQVVSTLRATLDARGSAGPVRVRALPARS